MFPRASRFEFVPGSYTGQAPAISCDGLVPGAALELTHWQGNHTPREFKADTSTEIALKFVDSQASLKWAGAIVVNNHFDTDGALSAWVLLDPDDASACRDLIIAAAEAGDFDEWPGQDRGLWLDAAIRALAATTSSDPEAYEVVLPQVADLAHHLDDRRELWGAEWDQLQASMRALEAGRLRAERLGRIGLMRREPGVPEVPGPILARQFLPHVDRYLLAFEQGSGTFDYRYERPRYAWADTVVRPSCPAPDAAAMARALGPAWTSEDLPGLTGIVQTIHAIDEAPEQVAQRLLILDRAGR
jgi:hypothetical protein